VGRRVGLGVSSFFVGDKVTGGSVGAGVGVGLAVCCIIVLCV